MGNKLRLVIVSILLFTGIFSIYLYSSGGNTIFNHFTLLADSFIHGKLSITGDYPWLEKIPIDQNSFYVANPPGPAFFSIPFVYIFGKDFPQQYLAHFFGALLTITTYFLAVKIQKSKKLAMWSAILIGFSSLNWYLSSVGSTWYLAHLVAQVFLTLAILFSLKKLDPFWIGICIGLAYISRIPTILSLPLFLYFYKKDWRKNYLKLLLGILPFILINFIYNYLRFGVLWDIGYTMIPGVSTEPWYQKGIIHPSYIPNHLKIIFASVPNFFEFFKNTPSLSGYAIWFTTPAFVYSLVAKFNKNITKFSWLSILLVSLIIFSHGSTGFSQFGYRFATDFYPILSFLTIKGVVRQKGPKWHHWTLLTFGILINLWGVIFINKLGFVGW